MFCIFSFKNAKAEDYSWVVSGGNFYVSSFSDAVVYFYGEEGQHLIGKNYTLSINLSCGVGNFQGLLFTGYNTVNFIVPKNDFYVFLCIKTSGISGETTVGVTKDTVTRKVERNVEISEDKRNILSEKILLMTDKLKE